MSKIKEELLLSLAGNRKIGKIFVTAMGALMFYSAYQIGFGQGWIGFHDELKKELIKEDFIKE